MPQKLDLTDKLSILCAILSAPYFLVFNYFGFHLAGNLSIFAVVSFLVPLIFNHLKYPLLARFLFIIVATSVLFFYSLILGKSSGVYIVLISIVSLPVLLFEDKKVFKIILGSSIPISAAYFLEIVNDHFLFQPALLTGIAEKVIHGFAMSTAFLFVLISSFFFYIYHKKIADELSDSNLNLISAYESLEQSKLTIQKLQEQAAYASLAKGISYEIRNPLSIILSCWEIISKNMDKPDIVSKFSAGLEENIQRIVTVTNTMLAYGKVAAKNKKELRLNAELSRIVGLMQDRASDDYVDLVFEPGNVSMIVADPDALVQMIVPIVLNGIESIMATRISNPRIGRILVKTKKIKLQNGEDGVEISIQDNGEGISSKNQSKVFDSFFTTRHGQQGLGLAMVYKLVLEHQGTIQVVSEQFMVHGSEFVIRLPILGD